MLDSREGPRSPFYIHSTAQHCVTLGRRVVLRIRVAALSFSILFLVGGEY